jgi:hypothetical protein
VESLTAKREQAQLESSIVKKNAIEIPSMTASAANASGSLLTTLSKVPGDQPLTSSPTSSRLALPDKDLA